MPNLELNKQEAETLVHLIDVAVKTEGLKAAEASVYLVGKIQEAFKPEDPKEETEEEKAPKEEEPKEVVEKEG